MSGGLASVGIALQDLSSGSETESESMPLLTVHLDILKGLIEALKSAGDVIKSLGDGIAHLIGLGAKGVDDVSLRRTRSRLKFIYAHLVQLNAGQLGHIVGRLDEFVTLYDKVKALQDAASASSQQRDDYQGKLIEGWHTVTQNIATVLPWVKVTLDDVEHERSDFILKPAYVELVRTLNARNDILGRLRDLPMPSTDEEVALIRQAASQYAALVEHLRATNNALASYLAEGSGGFPPKEPAPGV